MAKNLVLNRSRKVPAEDTAAFGAIAERFRRAGALERAVELCREGLQKFPDHISARVTLGWSLLDLGKYDDARVELEQVLRRAPDNLAAIRGLAELHDRFEHTLHLPMDGPGQWPPPPESLDDAAGGVTAPATESDADAGDLEMTPAALGIPIFSPAAGSSPAVEPVAPPVASAPPPPQAPEPPPVVAKVAAAPIAEPAPAPKAAKPAKTSKAAATKTTPAVAEPAKAEPVVAPAVASAPPPPTAPAASAPTTRPGSGMSSVREIDFGTTASAGVPTPAAVPPPVTAAAASEVVASLAESSSDAYSVSDADIQALIAEADSLDAEAGMTPAESETVSLDAIVFDGADALAAVAGVEPARAMSYSSVTEPISVDFDLDTPPGGMAISLAELGVTAEPAAAASPTDEAGIKAAAEAAQAARAQEEAAQAARAQEEAAQAARAREEAAQAARAKEEAAQAARAREEAAQAARAKEEAAQAARAKEEAVRAARAKEEAAQAATPEPVVAPQAQPEVAPIAAMAAVVSIDAGRTAAKSPVPALERFLSKVQARKKQLMTESVA